MIASRRLNTFHTPVGKTTVDTARSHHSLSYLEHRSQKPATPSSQRRHMQAGQVTVDICIYQLPPLRPGRQGRRYERLRRAGPAPLWQGFARDPRYPCEQVRPHPPQECSSITQGNYTISCSDGDYCTANPQTYSTTATDVRAFGVYCPLFWATTAFQFSGDACHGDRKKDQGITFMGHVGLVPAPKGAGLKTVPKTALEDMNAFQA
ncbi:hypothetical protein VHEMI04054 [[Torrubiella] hemipterigena]|uniref:Uncharacterized protein n=1 Tax=[Torrubiella] hemipterigena TaxID=1531966 RepID=A0A0A1TCQ2_9HYPO|nr:hypothetical protein VHEMI04054 [[Torrubiella] hemipterigena]